MGLALDELKDDDTSYDKEGLTFLVNNDLMEQCSQIKVDFMDAGYRSGFSISSAIPISGGGGCGSSCSSGSCG